MAAQRNELVTQAFNFIPTTLKEAQETIQTDIGEPDLSPEGERKICQWAKEKYNSDFIFITIKYSNL